MKIKFFVVFSILLLNGFAFCGTQDPFSMEKQLQVLQSEFNMASQELNKEKAQMRKTIIQTNINFLENCLFQKIKKMNRDWKSTKITLTIIKMKLKQNIGLKN